MEYKEQVEKVANQLDSNGEPMSASQVVEKILRSLIDDFESIICAIEKSKDLSVLLVEELVGSLKATNKGKGRSTNRVTKYYRRNLI